MLTFPILKTGSAVQYPFSFLESDSTDVLQFLGGDEQRYRTTPGPLRKWIVRLELLDESELRALEAFFVAAGGSFGTFSFTDPASGVAHPNCYISKDDLQEQFAGELRTRTTVVIQEGRA